MKKSLSQAIAVATLLGAAASAQAVQTVEVNHEGIGGALLYPLYTVENGNTTLVSIVNTTNQAKAVKVRFVEAMNSAEVLDFHLYLSPQDKWGGTIVPTATGAKLVSNDTSCIAGYPDGFPAEGLEFRTDQLLKDIDDAQAVGQKTEGALRSQARTRIGHFEVIEMAEIAPTAMTTFGANGQAVSASNPAILMKDAITHIEKDGKRVPRGCAAITAEWNKAGGKWNGVFIGGNEQVSTASVTAGNPDLIAPTGGLYGTAVVINVASSWAASYDAVALRGIDKATVVPAELGLAAGDPLLAAGTGPEGGIYAAPQHPRPGSIYPNLATSNSSVNTNGHMTDNSLNDVSWALSLSKVYNDYFVDADFGGETDLVLSFPTKRFYVNTHAGATNLTPITWAFAADGVSPKLEVSNGQILLTAGPNVTAADAATGRKAAAYAGADAANLFFKHAWNADKNQACEYLAAPVVYDTEEGVEEVEQGFISPRPNVVGKLPLCHETNVVSLNDSNTFGADLVRSSLKTPFKAGWISLKADGYGNGLPVIGFANVVSKNGSDSVLRNFAQTFKNKSE